MTQKLIEHLQSFVTEERLQLFNQILNQRTRYLSFALENIYQPQNASAVLRTCDCFGLQDVHIIENEYEYNINPKVALGSAKWLSMHRYNEKQDNTQEAINSIRKKGYRIVATTPHTNDLSLLNFDLEAGPSVFFFGTELTGLSEAVLDQADEFVKIPMYGFTESFNISVSAAITAHELSTRLRKSNIDWHLKPHEKEELMFKWLAASIKRSEKIIKRFKQLPHD